MHMTLKRTPFPKFGMFEKLELFMKSFIKIPCFQIGLYFHGDSKMIKMGRKVKNIFLNIFYIYFEASDFTLIVKNSPLPPKICVCVGGGVHFIFIKDFLQ